MDQPTPTDRTAKRPASTGRKLLLVAIFWSAFVSIFAGIVGWTFWRHHDAQQRYLPAEGVVVSSAVVSSKVHSSKGKSSTTYSPHVEYRYVAAGQEYRSDRHSFDLGSSSAHSYAEKVVREHPKGRKITVYYDPLQPGEAVLSRDAPPMQYLLVLVLQPFLMVGLGMSIQAVSTLRNERRIQRFATDLESPLEEIPTWGRFQQDIDGLTLQNHGSLKTVILTLIFAYGILSFLAIPVVGLLLKQFDDPSRATLLETLAVCAGAAVTAGLLRLFSPNKKARLSLDDRMRTLSLTSRQRDVQLTYDDIDHWKVRMIDAPHAVTRQEKNKPPAKAPLLVLVDRNGQETPVHVFGADDAGRIAAERSAQVFAGLTASTVQPTQLSVTELSLEGVAMMEAARSGLAGQKAQHQAAKALADLT